MTTIEGSLECGFASKRQRRDDCACKEYYDGQCEEEKQVRLMEEERDRLNHDNNDNLPIKAYVSSVGRHLVKR